MKDTVASCKFSVQVKNNFPAKISDQNIFSLNNPLKSPKTLKISRSTPKKFHKPPPSNKHHPMDDPHPKPSNSLAFTVGVLIAATFIGIFTLFHLLRILLKYLKKYLATSDEIQLEPQTLTVKSREDARKLSSSCVEKLQIEMLKELKVDDANCVQFDLEKCDKLLARFDERRLRTQSTRVKGGPVNNQRVRKFGQTMKPMRNKTEEVTFFAGRSHRYMQDV